MEQSIQVTPITEGEIMSLRNLFNKFADTITDASRMRGEIDEVRKTLESLRQDNEYLRAHNREMDEALAEARRQRDNAYAELEQYKRNEGNERAAFEASQRTVNELRDECDRLRSNVVDTKRQSDDMAYANMELTDKVKAAREWIEGVSRLFNNPPVL